MLSFGVTVLPDPPYSRLIELTKLAESHGFEHVRVIGPAVLEAVGLGELRQLDQARIGRIGQDGDAEAEHGLSMKAVSYTHLTLPTICSV